MELSDEGGEVDFYRSEKHDERNERENMFNSGHKIYNDIWIIGGSTVYENIMNMNMNNDKYNDKTNNMDTNIIIDEFYITYIDKEYKCDTFFPLIENMNRYYVSSFNMCKCDDGTGCEVDVYFIVFKRISEYTKCDNDIQVFKKVCIDISEDENGSNSNYFNIESGIYDKGVIEKKYMKIFASFF
jgi:hypothetical protein